MIIFPILFAVNEYISCLVRPDLTLLIIKEAVDVRLAEADEGHEGKKMEGVHPSTTRVEFAL